MWYILLIPLVGVLYLAYKYKLDLIIIIRYLQIKYLRGKTEVPESELINDKVIKINYIYKSKIHSVYLPVYNIKFSDMNIKYYLITGGIIDANSGNASTIEVDITQQPGIEYHVTAEMLGGNKIISKKFDDTLTEFKEDEIPRITKLN